MLYVSLGEYFDINTHHIAFLCIISQNKLVVPLRLTALFSW